MFRRKFSKKVRVLKELSYWISLVILFLLFLRLIQEYKITSPEFSIREIKVAFNDGRVLGGKEGFKYTGLARGISIFKIQPSRFARKLLKEHPEAQKIEIYKKLPSELEIRVKNRTPVAQVYLGQFYPLDEEGFILPFPTNFRLEGLLNLKGFETKELNIGEENNQNIKLSLGLKIVEILKKKFEKDYYQKIDIDVSDTKNVLLTLPQGIEVKLGGDEFEEKLSRLKLVLADIKAKNIKPASIDLRFEKVILIPRD